MPKRPSLEDQIKSAQIVVKAVGDLVPYARNAKLHSDHQISVLVGNIKEYGWTSPCIITPEGDLIAGHGRLLAAHKLGLKEVPCIVMDHLTKSQIKALRISDNRISEIGGGYDSEMLNLDLYDLKISDYDMSLTGFDNDYISAALKDLSEEIDTESIDGVNRNQEVPEDEQQPGDVVDPRDEAEEKAAEEVNDVIPDKVPDRAKSGERWTLGANTLQVGDCVEFMKTLPSNSVGALVSDPPAGIAFMGKDWDEDKGGRKEWVKWMTGVMKEAYRVLKPGAHGLVWGIPRTGHWTAMALEDAGFEIRDVITHLFGSGFPKSLNISVAIDKAAGAERERGPLKLGGERLERLKDGKRDGQGTWGNESGRDPYTSLPATEAAKQWQGYGTALKPAYEPWYLVRKPCSEDTVAKNVLKHGVGGLNIDASRIGTNDNRDRFGGGSKGGGGVYGESTTYDSVSHVGGRFPANAVFSHNPDCVQVGTKKVKSDGNFTGKQNGAQLFGQGAKDGFVNSDKSHADADGTETVPAWECTPECPVAMLDAQSGQSKSNPRRQGTGNVNDVVGLPHGASSDLTDSGGASRFFKTFEGVRFKYVPKASKVDKGHGNTHPTPKSQSLMRYLIRMVTPPGETVLDPFLGSGSTLIACHSLGNPCFGSEKQPEYANIIIARYEKASGGEAKVSQ